MSRGIPLGDDDRIPWLNAIREAMLQWDAQHRNVVLACSALKRSYRELLQINSNVKLVYLKGSYELFRERLRSRKGHYAGEQILAGQFADLQEPTDAITIDAAQSRNKSSRKSASGSRYLKMRRLLNRTLGFAGAGLGVVAGAFGVPKLTLGTCRAPSSVLK